MGSQEILKNAYKNTNNIFEGVSYAFQESKKIFNDSFEKIRAIDRNAENLPALSHYVNSPWDLHFGSRVYKETFYTKLFDSDM